MCYKATEILGGSIDGFLKNNIELVNEAEKKSKELHYEETDIVNILVKKAKLASSLKERKYISGLITVGNHIELIEDNVLKLLGTIRKKIENSMLFSDKAVDELNYLFSNTKGILKSTADALVTKNRIIGKHILEEEEIIRNKACDFETVHEDRMISGVCVPEASRLYIDMVNSIREINWHIRQVLEKMFADK
ncbi:MAG: PhoU domain-containing protein [Candidatus Anammoxibacter sp.]